MYGLTTLANGREVVAIHAQFQGAFVAVQRCAPWILCIRWITVGAMLPDYPQIVVVESRGLGVGDVRLARLPNKNAASGRDALRPAQAKHPANHVEHVDAHVAHDPVSVFHERAPASR